MTDHQRFDLSFAGTLAPGADPLTARRQLMAAFKLDESGIDRLFTGQTLVIKREVDARLAEQYRRVFDQAGAVLLVMPVTLAAPPPPPAVTPAPDPAPALSLAPNDGFLEDPGPTNIPMPDTSHLSLVADSGWTLEDCDRPAPPIPAPDLSRLTLADPAS